MKIKPSNFDHGLKVEEQEITWSTCRYESSCRGSFAHWPWRFISKQCVCQQAAKVDYTGKW
ncbi:MAG: hypothetical protein IPJ39_19655 [Saprospiraceae bacterium]|nr:hypothetical protein [Saprospiraceae bacterium]